MNEEQAIKQIWEEWLPGAQQAYETAQELGNPFYTDVLADLWRLKYDVEEPNQNGK